MVAREEEKGAGRMKRAEGVKFMETEGDLALSGEHTVQYTDYVLWKCTIQMYMMLLTNATPINSSEIWKDIYSTYNSDWPRWSQVQTRAGYRCFVIVSHLASASEWPGRADRVAALPWGDIHLSCHCSTSSKQRLLWVTFIAFQNWGLAQFIHLACLFIDSP